MTLSFILLAAAALALTVEDAARWPGVDTALRFATDT